MPLEPYAALARALEREETLLRVLKELLISIDSSSVGPAARLLPKWQIEQAEDAIEASEEELQMLGDIIAEIDEGDGSD